MKILFLLRHAKSDSNQQALRDFERPLNQRGKRTVATLGAFITQERIGPDLVISSPAVRARETIEPILRSAGLRSELRFDERIYEAPPERLIEVISEVQNATQSLLLVGHNPGLEGLLSYLTGKTEIMATGALAKISFNETIPDLLTARSGKLEWLWKAD